MLHAIKLVNFVGKDYVMDDENFSYVRKPLKNRSFFWGLPFYWVRKLITIRQRLSFPIKLSRILHAFGKYFYYSIIINPIQSSSGENDEKNHPRLRV
jgi:hypothetical protein